MINVPGLGAGLSEPGEPEGKGADQLTLSQPGVQVMPAPHYHVPPFKFADLPTALERVL